MTGTIAPGAAAVKRTTHGAGSVMRTVIAAVSQVSAVKARAGGSGTREVMPKPPGVDGKNVKARVDGTETARIRTDGTAAVGSVIPKDIRKPLDVVGKGAIARNLAVAAEVGTVTMTMDGSAATAGGGTVTTTMDGTAAAGSVTPRDIRKRHGGVGRSVEARAAAAGHAAGMRRMD
jgi:hypothetical protein